MSVQTPPTPSSPTKSERRKALNQKVKFIKDAVKAYARIYAAINESPEKTARITVDSEQSNNSKSAQALAQRVTSEGSTKYVYTFTADDRNQLEKDLMKEISDIPNFVSRMSKRGAERPSSSGFNNPRKFNDEIINFLLNAGPLQDIVTFQDENGRVVQNGNLADNTSSQGVITSIMTMYVYDKTSPDHCSLVYHSRENINRINDYMADPRNRASIDQANLTDDELRVLQFFQAAQGPEGLSNDTVVSALRKIGIRKKHKIVDGQKLGADDYMLQNMAESLAEMVRRPAKKGRNRSADNFAFADLQTIAAINFAVDERGNNIVLKMTDEDKELYEREVAPLQSRFNSAYKYAKEQLNKATPTQDENYRAYEIARTSQVDYSQFDLANYSENGGIRLKIDADLQSSKMMRLGRMYQARYKQ